MRQSTIYTFGGISLLLLAVFACNKDKLNTRPSIKIKSVQNKTVSLTSLTPLIVEMDYADKEGDISNYIFVQKVRTNINPAVPLDERDTFSLAVPSLGLDRPDGQIELRLYGLELEITKDPVEPDTMRVRFALSDKAGHTSDTVEVEQVILKK